LTEKSRSRISSTKKTPAIGALKIELMPAAAPQPTSVRTSRAAMIERPP
jgi:hypothetical protein